MRIRNKVEFFALWEAGCLGNRTRLWRNPQEAFEWARANNHQGIGFREIRTGGAGAGKWEKVPWCKVLETARRWQAEGRNFIMDDGAPDEYRTLQGEICRTTRGMEGFLEIGGKLPMRPAMAAGLMKHYTYLQTVLLLNKYMDPSSRDDVDAIFDLYPDAAIEFTCFSVDAGIIPGRNTIFWETRDY